MNEVIVLTAEKSCPDETTLWNRLLESGLSRLHVRKPALTAAETGRLLAQLDVAYRPRVSVHYYPQLALDYGLGGVHYSYQILPATSTESRLLTSCSVHSWAEQRVVQDRVDYCFLSPVFDSISKQGYGQNANLWRVPSSLNSSKVYALGGIQRQNLQQVFEAGFRGAALLGAIWQAPDPVQAYRGIIQELNAYLSNL